jgi:hypothetical protein
MLPGLSQTGSKGKKHKWGLQLVRHLDWCRQGNKLYWKKRTGYLKEAVFRKGEGLVQEQRKFGEGKEVSKEMVL